MPADSPGKAPNVALLGAGMSSVGLRAKPQTDLPRAQVETAVPAPGPLVLLKHFLEAHRTLSIALGFAAVAATVALIFMMKGNGVAVEKIPAPAPKFKKPDVELVIDREWTKSAQALKGKERVDAVLQKLRELNPHFNVAKWTYAFDSAGNEIISVAFEPKSGVTNVSPVLAFSQLEGLAFDFDPVRDKSFLKEFAALKQVNGLTVDEIMKRETPMPSTYVPPPPPPPPVIAEPKPALKYDQDWTKQTLAMPPDKRPLAVLEKLQKLNPKFDMKNWSYSMDASGEVNVVYFETKSGADDFTPLLAFPKLAELAFDFDPGRDKLLIQELKALKKVNGVDLETVLKRDAKLDSSGKPAQAPGTTGK